MAFRAASTIAALVLSGASLFLAGCADMATGQLAYESGDYETASWHYRELAEFGLPEAKFVYARMLLKGEGAPVDQVRARELMKEAADVNYTRAYVDLAKMYLKGQGGPAYTYRARDLLEKAVAQGYTRASLDLAKLYQQGIGGPKDVAKARAIYLAQLNAGNVSMAYNLGRLAEEEGKPGEAAAYYKQAVGTGNYNAAKQLGSLYEKKFQPSQLVNALAWYYFAQGHHVPDLQRRITKLERKVGPGGQQQARQISKGL